MTDFFDELLDSMGIKSYDDLSPQEKDSYFKLQEIQAKGAVTIEDVRFHVRLMKQEIEHLLTKTDNPKKLEDQYKARIKNYLLLEALLERPERTAFMIKQYVKGKDLSQR